MSTGTHVPQTAPLLLASASPRRSELLGALGIPFEVAGGIAFPERAERDNVALSPGELAWYNAVGKALTAARLHPGRAILAADTVVSLDARVLGKPSDRWEAEATLRLLSHRTHLVQTAYVLVFPTPRGERPRFTGDIERTEVSFRRLTPEAIRDYLDAVRVDDKAGAYAIQERGSDLVHHIRGSYANVVGLPVEAVARLLRKAGFEVTEPGPTQWTRGGKTEAAEADSKIASGSSLGFAILR